MLSPIQNPIILARSRSSPGRGLLQPRPRCRALHLQLSRPAADSPTGPPVSDPFSSSCFFGLHGLFSAFVSQSPLFPRWMNLDLSDPPFATCSIHASETSKERISDDSSLFDNQLNKIKQIKKRGEFVPFLWHALDMRFVTCQSTLLWHTGHACHLAPTHAHSHSCRLSPSRRPRVPLSLQLAVECSTVPASTLSCGLLPLLWPLPPCFLALEYLGVMLRWASCPSALLLCL